MDGKPFDGVAHELDYENSQIGPRDDVPFLEPSRSGLHSSERTE